MGFFMRFEDDSVESAKIVKQWNVKIISVRNFFSFFVLILVLSKYCLWYWNKDSLYLLFCFLVAGDIQCEKTF